jgi:hypothetical protein
VSNFTAVYDACVLYPAPLRDLLMELALTDLFRARWSEEIHKEWIRNVLKNRPDDFILYLLDLYPVQVCSATEKVRQRLRTPVMNHEDYLSNLLRQGLPQTVSRMNELGYLDGYPFV